MTSERMIQAHLDRERARRNAARQPDDAATPQQKLVRAAGTGRFEAIVAAAQPAEPPKMVTPEEREAELRRTGKWPDPSSRAKRSGAEGPSGNEKSVQVEARSLRSGRSLPRGHPRGPSVETTEVSPQQQYIAEHCRWRARGPGDYRERVPYGRCLTEYDPLTGELIGDGYDHSGEEDDEW